MSEASRQRKIRNDLLWKKFTEGVKHMKRVMVCGIDCIPGAVNCNNYCNHDNTKPMPDSPPPATPAMQVASARKTAHEKLREAEKAWYEYFALCEVGDERTKAAEIYENIRTAARVG